MQVLSVKQAGRALQQAVPSAAEQIDRQAGREGNEQNLTHPHTISLSLISPPASFQKLEKGFRAIPGRV